MNWKQREQAFEDAYVRRLLIEYGIREVTTQKQAKNGTREFEFPVPAYSKQRLSWMKSRNYNLNKLPRLRLACFKTGYVRNQNSCSSNYQLNKQYKQNVRWTLLDGDKLVTHKSVMIAREKIYSGMARLNYMLEFYKRNYLNK